MAVPKVFVVTCLRDFDLFALMCASVKKFLNITEFNIVINENDIDKEIWMKKYLDDIEPIFRDSHTINLLHKVIPNHNHTDWITQQLIKLYCLDPNNPYIVLDSGNIFIKPIDVSNIVNDSKYEIRDLCSYNSFAYACHYHFSVTQCRGARTPHIINPEVCRKIFQKFGGYYYFESWFYGFQKYGPPSEFIIHDMAAMHFNLDFEDSEKENYYNHPIWNVLNKDEYKFIFEETLPHAYIVTLHTRVLLDSNFSEYRAKLNEITKYN
jgi:hypothetical protein